MEPFVNLRVLRGPLIFIVGRKPKRYLRFHTHPKTSEMRPSPHKDAGEHGTKVA
jgi:hypothetical protein